MSRVPINVVLVAPQIPHNTGAIGRLCVGLGASLHLIRPLGFMLSANAIRRSGLDYWPHLDVTVHDNWETFLEATQPVQLCFASTKATASLYDCPFRPGCCLVFGNEGEGLPSVFYTRYASDLWQIPMPGEHARSLNLATAVAIVMYEAYRQLRVPSL
ncbi:MAG TPA: tRNA (uridine(34)/cytosine(34)/5-carboxymethylaminomethyluridine(34)-2'-O)-methyltransferase TrmL [Verrucomicrobia bacterium]|nr:tRNA (uridine(34)/cytosine(34)/5-carboxymethylaminomethyluridine(34)-2'-O)-methyltransferase TrmL [Verrucomicrobiota bacterium]